MSATNERDEKRRPVRVAAIQHSITETPSEGLAGIGVKLALANFLDGAFRPDFILRSVLRNLLESFPWDVDVTAVSALQSGGRSFDVNRTSLRPLVRQRVDIRLTLFTQTQKERRPRGPSLAQLSGEGLSNSDDDLHHFSRA
jgi:hypothetical protein